MSIGMVCFGVAPLKTIRKRLTYSARILAIALSGLSLFGGRRSDASSFTFNAPGGDLSIAANYQGGTAPGNDQDIAFFNPSGGAVTNSTFSSVNSFTFNSGSGGFTLSGNALTIDAGITNNSGSLQTLKTDLTLSADQSLNASAGALIYTGTLDTQGNTLTVNGANNTTFSGIVTTTVGSTGGLIKNGGGTAFLDGPYTGLNGYLGSTVINSGTLRATKGALVQNSSVQINGGGTLLLSNSGRHLGANTSVVLNGGTFDTGSYSEPSGGPGALPANAIGALTLTATSTIDFGGGNSSILEFAGVGTHTSGAILQITNWDRTFGPNPIGSGDGLYFLGTATEFTTKYLLTEVSFNGDIGYDVFQYSGYYEVVGLTAVPEPATWVAGILAVAALGFSQRRRFARLVSR